MLKPQLTALFTDEYEWLPMEDAPHNTNILLSSNGGVFCGYFLGGHWWTGLCLQDQHGEMMYVRMRLDPNGWAKIPKPRGN